jgi:mono/diheme cytochrome c family protein
MKSKCVILAVALSMVSCTALWAADDGAALYKKKCAACHGANGEGKPALKAPPLKGIAMDANQITEWIMKGASGMKPPHNKGVSGLTEDQAKAIAEFVKTL